MSLRSREGRGREAARRERPARDRSFRPAAGALEPRVLLSTAPVEPTADEQYMLELVNRARANPAAEAQWLLSVARTDPLIRSATQGWDLGSFARLMSSFGPRPPLAFNTRLIEAARAQDAAMLASNDQRHSPPGYLTDASVATASDGRAYYPVGPAGWSTGENIFAYSQNVRGASVEDYINYYHEGLLLDWGNPDFGHLRNLLAPGASGSAHVPFSEIGIGLLTDAAPTVPPPPNPELPGNAGLNVGPVLLTQEFGWRQGDAFLTGVAYRDADGDQFYSPGEGLGGVTIQAVGREGQGTYQVQTWQSGGYSLALPPGTYTVTATGNVPYPQSTVVAIGQDNVGWDVTYAPDPLADRPVPADYDGDGKTDLAVYRPDTAEWFLLQSSAGGRRQMFGAPNLDQPVPGDYDGDGRTDLAVYRPTTAQWFLLQSSAGPRGVAFGAANLDIPVPGDYDGDGKTDLAVYRPTTAHWFILRSSAGPEVVQYGLPGVDLPVVADYDGDGQTDIAVYRPTTAQWFILQSSGSPRELTFGAPNLDVPMPADYDGDGRADIAVYRPTSAQWLMLQSSAGARFQPFGAPGIDRPVPGDYDGDGRTDLAVFRPETAQWFIMGTSDGGRMVTFGRAGVVSPPAEAYRPTIANGDLLPGRLPAVSGQVNTLRARGLTASRPPNRPNQASPGARRA